MQRLRSNLTYANVISTICLFVVLGGGAYAASQLPKNSVGTKQLKDKAVTGAKVKDGSLTGSDINASTLGTVPKATSADSAGSASSAAKAGDADKLGGAGPSAYVKGADAVGGSALAGTYASPTLKAAEAMHQVGTGGNPPFAACKSTTPFWVSPSTPTVEPVKFYRDPYGTVRISGSVKCAEAPENGHDVFVLPEGFRPTNQLNFATAQQSAGTGSIQVLGNGRVVFSSTGVGAETRVSLDGVDFRCAPSGVAGCP